MVTVTTNHSLTTPSLPGRCNHSLTREGKPLSLRPDMVTEVYFVMALYELHYATKQANYLVNIIWYFELYFGGGDISTTKFKSLKFKSLKF